MLLGAFLCVAFTVLYNSVFIGIAAAMAGTVILSVSFALSITRLRANTFISGLGFNLLIAGLVSMVSVALFNTKGVIRYSSAGTFTETPFRFVSGAGIFSLLADASIWLSVILPFAAFALIQKTPLGLRMRVTGYDPEALEVSGVRPGFYKELSIVISSVFAAISGILLSLRVEAYVPGISAGRGWIALVLIYLGNKKPVGVLAAALVFSSITQFANIAEDSQTYRKPSYFPCPGDFQ